MTPPLSEVQHRALAKLTRKWTKASTITERLDTLWALYQKDKVEIKVIAYCFQWRRKCETSNT